MSVEKKKKKKPRRDKCRNEVFHCIEIHFNSEVSLYDRQHQNHRAGLTLAKFECQMDNLFKFF